MPEENPRNIALIANNHPVRKAVEEGQSEKEREGRQGEQAGPPTRQAGGSPSGRSWVSGTPSSFCFSGAKKRSAIAGEGVASEFIVTGSRSSCSKLAQRRSLQALCQS